MASDTEAEAKAMAKVRAEARLLSEQALIGALLKDPIYAGTVARESGVRSSDFGNPWLQHMYGALVEDGLWNHPYVTSAPPYDRTRIITAMLFERLRTRMQAAADAAAAELAAWQLQAEHHLRVAKFAGTQAEEAAAETAWWAKNFPNSQLFAQAKHWEMQAHTRALVTKDAAAQAVKRRDEAAKIYRRLDKTVKSPQAWDAAWEAVRKVSSPEDSATPQNSPRYARLVLEQGISTRAHTIGQKLLAQVNAPATGAMQQLADIHAALDALGQEALRDGPVEPIWPIAPEALRPEDQQWESRRAEGRVLISVIAHPEQLNRNPAAALTSRDMTRPEHAYLLAAAQDHHARGLGMDAYQLASEAWSMAARDGVVVETGYMYNLAMNAKHPELSPGGPPPAQMAHIADVEAPSLIQLTVQRTTAAAVAQLDEQLQRGVAPRQAVATFRSGLAYAAEQAHRHPQTPPSPLSHQAARH
ncbi:hypothetical protein ACH4VR_36265 [Streptomyces sp. NPDC020883]|uniref:hypothetical protein n=1 Tax=Streptomyces sp. NPDC020883 TaxID=3365099 RepID=UPI0037915FB0